MDIDGVLITYGEKPVPHAVELIDYLVNNHEVYWLTTHCRGDSVATQQHLSRFFHDQATLKNIGKIKATNWEVYKTEAIDFSKPFSWLDDDLMFVEQAALEENNAIYSMILIDILEEPLALKRVLEDLKFGRKPKLPATANLDY